MIGRALALTAGIAGAGSMAQFPEYSQQYVQRLAGRVDELKITTERFDATAKDAGLTREEALGDLSGSEFRDQHGENIRDDFDRYERLSASLTLLRQERAAGRLALSYSAFDADTAKKAWDDFRPALPLTVEGGAFALGGFVGGFALISGLGALMPRRKKRVSDASV